jgi:hypothetical protein
MSLAELEKLLVDFMSTDNAVRSAAEKQWESAKETPDQLIVLLLQSLFGSQNAEVFPFSVGACTASYCCIPHRETSPIRSHKQHLFFLRAIFPCHNTLSSLFASLCRLPSL